MKINALMLSVFFMDRLTVSTMELGLQVLICLPLAFSATIFVLLCLPVFPFPPSPNIVPAATSSPSFSCHGACSWIRSTCPQSNIDDYTSDVSLYETSGRSWLQTPGTEEWLPFICSVAPFMKLVATPLTESISPPSSHDRYGDDADDLIRHLWTPMETFREGVRTRPSLIHFLVRFTRR